MLTHAAALTRYPGDPANASIALTESIATILPAGVSGVVATPVPQLYGPAFQTPVPTLPTLAEAVSLVGVGVVIGLIVGGPMGIVLGLFLGRGRRS
jgi:hypothetical protein